jgi:hypothetical protein
LISVGAEGIGAGAGAGVEGAGILDRDGVEGFTLELCSLNVGGDFFASEETFSSEPLDPNDFNERNILDK